MSTKSTGLLLALAAILFAFVWWVERPNRARAAIPPNHRVLTGMNPASISAVEVQIGGGARIRADKTNQVRPALTNQIWQLTRPEPYPAFGAVIDKLLQELAQWDWQSAIDHPDSWKDYGLDQPQFTLLLQENGRERALNIGAISPVGDVVYLNVRGSDQILAADTNVLNWIPTNQIWWRDRTVLNLDETDFQKLQVRSTNWGDSLLERDAGTRLWKMTKPMEARADTPRINQWLAALQALRVQAFVPDDARELISAGVSGQLFLTFLDATGTNKALELQAGDSPAGLSNLVYARRLDPPGLIEIDKAPLLPWEGDYINFLDRHLLSVSPDLIGSIEISGHGIEPFTVQKTAEGSWRVIRAGGETLEADQMLMMQLLSAFTNIQLDLGRSPVADKALYGLDKPASALLRYRLFSSGPAGRTNPPLADLLFGLGTNQPVKINEMTDNQKYVNSIAPEQFTRLPKVWWQLRNLDIWHFETNEVAAIDIHQHGSRLRLARDAQNQWTLQPGSVTNVSLVPPGIEETLWRMGRLRGVYWSGYGDEHLSEFGFEQTDYQIAFEINRAGQMQTNTIQFGKPAYPLLHPYASVMRDGQRLIFEFPADLYSNMVASYLGIPQPQEH